MLKTILILIVPITAIILWVFYRLHSADKEEYEKKLQGQKFLILKKDDIEYCLPCDGLGHYSKEQSFIYSDYLPSYSTLFHKNEIIDIYCADKDIYRITFDTFLKYYTLDPDNWARYKDCVFKPKAPIVFVMKNQRESDRLRKWEEEGKRVKALTASEKKKAQLFEKSVRALQRDIEKMRQTAEKEIATAKATAEMVQKNLEGK